MRCIAFFCVLGIFAPLGASAATVSTWDFRGSQMAQGWGASYLIVTPGPEGLRIRSEQQGALFHGPRLAHPIEAVRLTFAATTGQMEAIFAWQPRSAAPGTLLQIPVRIEGTSPETVDIDLWPYEEWDSRPETIAIGFPPGADVTLASVEAIDWSALENATEAWKSFWVFDDFKAYSINFLWGPLLHFNPIGRSRLFQSGPGLPPIGWSGNRLFYLVLGALAGLCALHWILRTRCGIAVARRRVLGLPPEAGAFALAFLAVWAVFDLRMGAETISYAIDDYRTHVAPPPGARTFRDYLNFYDALERSMPVLASEPHYAFLTVPATPLPTRARYHTYPSTPLFEGEDASAVRNWLVFKREDVSVGSGGRLFVGGQPVSAPGRILERFDDSSFIFQASE